MATYLGAHPDIYMSAHKEPHFFNDDLHDPVVRMAWKSENYLSLFAEARDERIVGEASVLYLFSEVAFSRIRAFEPESKILVMLRSPIELVHAFHSQLLFSGQETQPDLVKAWRARTERPGSDLLDYGRVASLGEQLQRARDVFPEEQILAVLYEDFAQDNRRAYRQVLSFLGVEDDRRADFPVINSSYRHRFRTLQRIIEILPEPKTFKKLLGIERLGVLDRVADLNVVKADRPPMPPDLVDELRDFFTEDVALLSRILGRDLRHWLDSPDVG